MKTTQQVERKQKAYNRAMKKRSQVTQSAGKEPVNRKEPQVRTLPLPTVQRVTEPFTKTSSKERKLAKILLADSRERYNGVQRMTNSIRRVKSRRARKNEH